MELSSISKRLEVSRKDLLDLGLRNPMLNFKPHKKSLAIVDERSEEILRILCQERKTMTFIPLPQKAIKKLAENSDETNESEEILESTIDTVDWSGLFDEKETNEGPTKRYVDNKLQTALADSHLVLRLLKIQTAAKTYIEEQGVNILFLALGFLHWYEDDSSQIKRKAPLLMVPVSLNRKGARDAFYLEFTGDDPVQNLSLAAKLKSEFSIDFPVDDLEFGEESSAENGEAPLASFFKKIAHIIRNNKRWEVVPDEIHLGFFSFGKFLMFKDLDESIWPTECLPRDNPTLARILGEGFPENKNRYPDDTNVDTIKESEECQLVKDADSTQMLALVEAHQGRHLVIQGPPGTGKSQTITNIIANCIASGKTVLFVSEKMAALEVVKRRLDEVNLGDAVLELHSHKSNKLAVLQEIARTLGQGRPEIEDDTWENSELNRLKNDLNEHCTAVNCRIGKSDHTFVSALGLKFKLLRSNPDLRYPEIPAAAEWSEAQYRDNLRCVEDFTMHLQAMENPVDNPFWGCELNSITPAQEDALAQSIGKSLDHLDLLLGKFKDLFSMLAVSEPISFHEAELIYRATILLSQAPPLGGVPVKPKQWRKYYAQLVDLIQGGERRETLRKQFGDTLMEIAWKENLTAEKQALIKYGSKWWRFLSSDFRKTRQKIKRLCQNKHPRAYADLLALIEAIMECQRLDDLFRKNSDIGEKLMGHYWKGIASEWKVLRTVSGWIKQLHEDIEKGYLPEYVLNILTSGINLNGIDETAKNFRSIIDITRSELRAVSNLLAYPAQENGPALEDMPFNSLRAKLLQWKDGGSDIYPMVRYNSIVGQLKNENLEVLVSFALNLTGKITQLIKVFEISRCSALLKKAVNERPELHRFDRTRHESIIRRYQLLDKKLLGRTQQAIAHTIWKRMPGINQPGQMSIIRKELNKKRKLLPLRQLIDQTGEAIQEIKPVFMMSPMSIATFLPPGRLNFDTVIFDEASQVKSVDAFGAILRGKQVIVVGDTKQMPPTNFFNTEVDLEDEDSETADIESILSLFRAKGVDERCLRWHYRSRHESLVAVSNTEFYDRKLVVFPGSGSNPDATGIKFHLNKNAFFDRGRTRTNKEEANAVAKAIMNHAKNRSHLSLGVAAFSAGQRDLIQVELELLRQEDSSAENFFRMHPIEPFFIKNLENVQGDERDVIFISIGYGRNESGKIAKNFGPVNNDGGERRLNVLITRAKYGLEVFCNFSADELELDADTKHGVRALKHFLKYAETKELEMPIETGKGADSYFEEEVRLALMQKGHIVEAQVGMAGYFIDMAIKDPECLGRYLIAIECDGATYHRSRSARDRDRLRQEVLEGLGWRFHRIWSTDWFRNPVKELERVEDAIKRAKQDIEKRHPEEETKNGGNDKSTEVNRTEVTKKSSYSATPYQKAMLARVSRNHPEFHETDPQELAKYVSRVVQLEAPVHKKEAMKRVMDSFRISRAGRRVEEAMEMAIDSGKRMGLFFVENNFLYRDAQHSATIRDRSNMDAAIRNIEMIAPEEIDMAILKTVELGFSVSSEEAILGACSLLGFARVTEGMADEVRNRLTRAIKNGTVKEAGDSLVL